ncbi:uncharacterized protein KY384_008605 [Bacidia gigantensis]|uniref:uncharacterized protein n=1 Tax=Bacidia gigantensis TaxID=2732470 RepID=UPI001D0494EB|nr:uncharacterized protein KY384_008605 [Bacidia gigantensis]KAG8527175.1 hypothetical protein KY384_008605 [Bacidia gigantensis]
MQNRIKIQAREHERFRRVCVNLAQGIHQWDMRFRLGLLQDQATIDKQLAREAAESQAKKHKHEAPTVRTEAQTIADQAAAKNKEKNVEKAEKAEKEKKKQKPKIRPLSEAKAIDSGANFVSETFLLIVAVGCVIGERWYSSKKDTARREDVGKRIEELEQYEKSVRRGMVELEKETLRLEEKAGFANAKKKRILPKEVYELEEEEELQPYPPRGWFSWLKGSGTQKDEPLPESERNPPEPEPESQASPTTGIKPSPSLYEKILHPRASNPPIKENPNPGADASHDKPAPSQR